MKGKNGPSPSRFPSKLSYSHGVGTHASDLFLTHVRGFRFTYEDVWQLVTS